MRAAAWLIAGAFVWGAGGCRNEPGGAMGTGERAGNKSGDLDHDLRGVAYDGTKRLEEANPGARSALNRRNVNRGTNDQRTAGVTAGLSVGSTPRGAATDTLGADRDINSRTALGTPGSGSLQPDRARSSNLPGQAPSPGASTGAAAQPK